MKVYIKPDFKYWSAENLNKIKARMSGERSGSESFPYEMTAGRTHTFSISNNTEYWLKCEISGVVDYKITTSHAFNINVYKADLIGKTKLDTHVCNKSISETIYDSSICLGNNTYKFSIKAAEEYSRNASVTVTISQHIDIAESSIGGIWKPDSNSGYPNTYIQHDYKQYLNKDLIQDLENIVSDDAFLENAEKCANGTMDIATIAIPTAFPAKIAIILETIFGVISFSGNFTSGIFSFREQFIEKIDDIAGYQGTENGHKIYTRGACLTHYRMVAGAAVGSSYYDIEAWDTLKMEGAEGEKGSWDIFE